ncbi:MAG: hypothetical protein KHZ46_05575 [Granulicatella adiacens]|nr:hypothetical protein [Granulicatella adiacens]
MNKTTKLLGLAAASLLAACSNQAATAETTQATTAQPTTVQATTQATATTDTNTTVATNNASEEAMGSQNAMQKEIVDAFKKEFPALDITGLEYSNGMFYEVEAMNDTNEYTYRYDKSAKTFMKVNETTSDKEEHDEEKIDLATLKQVDEMAAIAQKEFPTGVLREWSVDKDHGEVIWEFDLSVNGQQVNVKISNDTGKITEIDR